MDEGSLNKNAFKQSKPIRKKDRRPVLQRGEILKWIKTRDVINPQYGTSGSVGIDFFVPKFTEKFLCDLMTKNEWVTQENIQDFDALRQIMIPPHKDICIPSGIKMRLPKDTALMAFNKSGISTKKKLIKGAELVDWDYQGEIHCHVINTTDFPQTLEENKKVVQFVLVPVIMAKMAQVSNEEELYPTVSDRGEKWQGSTDANTK